jgi:uncharacterized repeat protein (TIGR02543 family)
MSAQADSGITLPSGSGLTRASFAFVGWNTNAAGTGTTYYAGSFYMATGNTTLYAKWDNSTYTVSFDANGGSGTPPSSESGQYGSVITLPSGSGLTRAGFVFVGWNASAAGTGTAYSAGPSYTVTSTTTLYARWIEVVVSTTGVELILVPGGSFWMGSFSSEAGSQSIERPRHQVTLSAFSMGKYEVTQEQYQAVMGTNPSYFTIANHRAPAIGETGAKRPVETVSWYDALVFCNKLSVMEGLTPAYSISGSTDPAAWGSVPPSTNHGTYATWNQAAIVAGSNGYRLPTEAQWEYAARGGATDRRGTGTMRGAIMKVQTMWRGTTTTAMPRPMR